MSQKELDGGLLALMEIHCKDMRKQYGHLRIDKLAEDQPIPFPHRQMSTFFALQIASNKELKIWFQLEKVLFDHYETPLDIPTYMGVQPRQMGKATEAGRLIGLLDLDRATRGIEPIRVPPRSDLAIDWTAQLYGRRVGPGGHADKEEINSIGKSGLNIFNLTRQKPISLVGMDPGGRSISLLRACARALEFDMRIIDDDEPPEAEHSTDYRKPRGWKRIPKQIPNQAEPSPLLLALLKRSA